MYIGIYECINMNVPKGYLSTAQSKRILNVSQQTLVRWADNGTIDFIKPPGRYTNRRYNVKKFIESNSYNNISDKLNICYCRVSTRNQRDDLLRQIEFMRKRYPTYTIVNDIGSGLNFNRRGFLNIVEYAIQGRINEVVVAYKDRLCRFGFELIRHLVETYSDGKIVVLKQIKLSPQEEMVSDILSIINVFSARLNGLRSYKTQILEDQNIANDEAKENL